ncbi:hypothetical protein D6764_05550 [Candidatus Woesearchaeota archaeon]|nr:MAG: hypothetical protein D6764_05550 [Candidatus Woesearchaeota archaeon]
MIEMTSRRISGLVNGLVASNRMLRSLLKLDLVNRSALARRIQDTLKLDRSSFHAVLAALRRLDFTGEKQDDGIVLSILGLSSEAHKEEISGLKFRIATGLSITMLHESAPPDEIGRVTAGIHKKTGDALCSVLSSSRMIVFPDDFKKEVLEKLAAYALDYKSGLTGMSLRSTENESPAFILPFLPLYNISPVAVVSSEKELFMLLKKGDASTIASLLRI